MKGSSFLSLPCDDLSCSLNEPIDKCQKQQNLPSHATAWLAHGFGMFWLHYMLTLRQKKRYATIKAEGLHLTAEAPKFLHGRLGPDDQPNVAILRALVAILSTTP